MASATIRRPIVWVQVSETSEHIKAAAVRFAVYVKWPGKKSMPVASYIGFKKNPGEVPAAREAAMNRARAYAYQVGAPAPKVLSSGRRRSRKSKQPVVVRGRMVMP